MKLDLDLLKNNLDKFADEFKLTIIKEIGNLIDKSSSVDDFKSRLDELCRKTIGKTSVEVLAGFSVRFPDSEFSPEPQPFKNSALQNELVEVREKIDKLDDRDKPRQAESGS